MPSLAAVMSFADIISHVAFLRTIPAPIFNSDISINMMDSIINLKENSFNLLPHKNSDSIKILIECLDFHTILKCIKGLIFDKTLIVFSYETSLLFQIVEGLKQLIFPFTVDFKQFLPANDRYRDMAGLTLKDMFEEFDGMQPLIFAIRTIPNETEMN
mmetsp:Transcript_30244/g.46247  ORF Transcript_30244/g.46247 Transcript_30244/m.46247 type:complete len:158 (-) Transcript_30244:5867-6340(-)